MRFPRRLPFALALGALAVLAAPTLDLPIAAAHAATIEVLSTNRMLWASAYANDGVTEFVDDDTLTGPGTEPFSETVTATMTVGSIVSDGMSEQTSSFTTVAFHAQGVHDASADSQDPKGFSIGGGNSTFEVDFRLAQASGYTFTGFVEGVDLGWTSASLTGPAGTVFSYLAGAQHIPISQSGMLAAGDYHFSLISSGTAHGWPPFPSHSSGAYEAHFALDSASGAPLLPHAPHAFPNPFASEVRIVTPAGASAVHVYDTAGRLVRALAGPRLHVWDGRDEGGAASPSGVYFLKAAGVPDAPPTKLVRVR
jgi:hypothetical protein